MTRRLTVTFVTRSHAVLRGYGSRALIEELRGHPPVWSSTYRGWHCQPKTARNVVALAEMRGYQVEDVHPADLAEDAAIEAAELQQQHAQSKGELF